MGGKTSMTTPPPYSYQSVSQQDDATAHPDPALQGEVNPDDFKIGVTVEQSAPEIRAMFVRKVYSVLFCQLLGTCLVAGIMNAYSMGEIIQRNPWVMFVLLAGSLGSLALVYWKRSSHPANLVSLGVFTAFEALMLGAVVCFVEKTVVLKAVILTTFVFLGLTLYTLQSKYDFSSLQSWLYWGLLILIGTGLVQMFFPYHHLFELAYATAGCAIFSGYIMYDTWLIQRRLSMDDWVLANISLYLDVVNLFISILRVMNASSDE